MHIYFLYTNKSINKDKYIYIYISDLVQAWGVVCSLELGLSGKFQGQALRSSLEWDRWGVVGLRNGFWEI